MARRRKTRRKTAKRRTTKRRKGRTAAQRRATAALVALNKARAKGRRKPAKRKASTKGKGSSHKLPPLPHIYRRGASIHTQPTYQPRSVHRHTLVRPRVDHDFED